MEFTHGCRQLSKERRDFADAIFEILDRDDEDSVDDEEDDDDDSCKAFMSTFMEDMVQQGAIRISDGDIVELRIEKVFNVQKERNGRKWSKKEFYRFLVKSGGIDLVSGFHTQPLSSLYRGETDRYVPWISSNTVSNTEISHILSFRRTNDLDYSSKNCLFMFAAWNRLKSRDPIFSTQDSLEEEMKRRGWKRSQNAFTIFWLREMMDSIGRVNYQHLESPDSVSRSYPVTILSLRIN